LVAPLPPSADWESRLDQSRLALRDGRLKEGEDQAARLHAHARAAGQCKVAADAAVLLAKLKGNMHLPTEALAWTDQALADARQAQDAGREAVAWAVSASAWAEAHRPLDALRAAQRAASLADQVVNPGHLQSLQTALVITYNALGLSHLALGAARRALGVAMVHDSPADRVLLRWNLLVSGLKVYEPASQAEPEVAAALLNELVAEARHVLADPELEVSPALGAGSCASAGEVLSHAGLLDEALVGLLRGVAPGFEEPADEMMIRWDNLARTQLKLGLADEANVSSQQARTLALSARHEGRCTHLPTLARVASVLGEHATALELTERHHAHVVRMLVAAFELRTAELIVDLARKSSDLELKHLRLHNRRLTQDVEHLALAARSDGLTGLLNRRGLEEAYAGLRGRLASMAVLLIDIDHFKQVNDRHSHLVGDAVLRRLGHELADELRSPDIVGRYGGEEFLALITGVDLMAARAVAERMRQRVARATWHDLAPGLHVTISGGLALAREVDDFTAVVARVDPLLYEAKNQGRNRIVSSAWRI
jgi:diguanylate cyclase (GGDEF)-like protein